MAISPAPHLLTLPREIRDEIYGYLHQRLEPKSMQVFQVTVSNAPLLPVLLTHSRLHEEYLQADCFRNLAAIVQCRYEHPNAWLSNSTPLRARDIAALARVRHTTLFVAMYRVSTVLRAVPAVQEKLDVLSRMGWRTSCQITLRVALKDNYLGFATNRWSLDPSVPLTSRLSLQKSLAGMAMIQHAGGYKYELDFRTSIHHLFEVRVYLYANTPNEKLWTLKEASEWPGFSDYYKLQLARLNPEQRENRAPPSSPLLGWIDEQRS
ncbi:hypothetical protein OPT61_g4966 [Boeremia exigua]|uniref:Uncharacterized protein n=1 Tax=Boeremia exigua TaxID=749465 RepID=A0ACC2IC45_9PLEO|nr:hypothetical protein OPT61_g4966 [Boeremia exigua]